MKNICCFVFTFLISTYTLGLAIIACTPAFNDTLMVKNGSLKILEIIIIIKYVSALIVSIPEKVSFKQAFYGFLTIDILAVIFVKHPGFPAGLLLFIFLAQMAITAVHYELEKRQKRYYMDSSEITPVKPTAQLANLKIALSIHTRNPQKQTTQTISL